MKKATTKQASNKKSNKRSPAPKDLKPKKNVKGGTDHHYLKLAEAIGK